MKTHKWKETYILCIDVFFTSVITGRGTSFLKIKELYKWNFLQLMMGLIWDTFIFLCNMLYYKISFRKLW